MATTTNTNSPLDLLSSVPLFQELSSLELHKLAECLSPQIIPKNETIYKANSFSDSLFILTNGTVKIGTDSSEGREVIKQILHPISIFGELGLVGEERRQDTAVAMNNEVHLLTLQTHDLINLMRHNHGLSLRLLQWFGSRLRHTEHRLESLILKDARQRIIDFLKDAAHQRGQRIGYETLIKHSLTQQDIANITGTSRQTVTSVLNDLRKNNLIHFTRRRILIRDLAKL
jgi:CRP/FNR family cyclic AMP-dependent transcriptional regulator